MDLDVGVYSEKGPRAENQDVALHFTLRRRGTATLGDCLIIADGMGGEDDGRWCARTACDRIGHHLSRGASPHAAIVKSHQDLRDAMRQRRIRGGTTLVVARLDDRGLALAWVGDSAAVLNGELLTRPHNAPGLFLARGQLSEVDYRDSPGRHALLAFCGSEGPLGAEELQLPPVDHGVLVLATDGVFDPLGSPRLDALARSSPTAKEAARAIVAEALAEGSRDNCTVIVARW